MAVRNRINCAPLLGIFLHVALAMSLLQSCYHSLSNIQDICLLSRSVHFTEKGDQANFKDNICYRHTHRKFLLNWSSSNKIQQMISEQISRTFMDIILQRKFITTQILQKKFGMTLCPSVTI